MFSESRFASSLNGLGLPHSPKTYQALKTAYGNPTRHYHGQEHVSECLRHLDEWRSLAIRPYEIEIAIWFHDAVYETPRVDNEEQSAIWAKQFLISTGAQTEVCQRIYDMIMATQTHEASGSDIAFMLDIDLGILGAPPTSFERYDAAIRQEYHWVSADRYRLGRAQILSNFLNRESIYQTPAFYKAYEQQARVNLAAKLDELAV